MSKYIEGKKVTAKIYLDDNWENSASRTITNIAPAVSDADVTECAFDIFSLQKYEVDRILLVETYSLSQD